MILRIQNFSGTQNPAELRDWLLPMLMSGQVTVKGGYNEVEDMVSGVAAEDVVKYRKG